MSKFNTCLRNGCIAFGDDFGTVAEVAGLFGPSVKKSAFENCFEIPGHSNTIGCTLSDEGGKGWHNVREFGPNIDSKGWNEVLTVVEFNDDPTVTKNHINEEFECPRTRHVFYRENRQGASWWKFYGEFKIDADSTRATLSSERPAVIYRRESKKVECNKVDVVSQVFTDAEFNGLPGRPVMVKLLDDVHFTADCGKLIAGSVIAMPGINLSVVSVDHGAGRIVCETEDADLLSAVRTRMPVQDREKNLSAVSFSLPLEDFRLGYVNAL